MNENKRRSLTLIVITVATLVLVVGMATYAFFATTRDVGNAINASVGTAASMYSFSATSNGNIEMNIAFNEMSEANVSTNVLKTDNATINVSLASPTNDMKTVCTYDIVWVWDSDENNRYTSPDMTLPSTIDNKTYNYEFSAKVDSNEEKDLSKYSSNGNIVTLQSGVTIESNSTTAIEKQHTIDAYIYNLPVNQEKLFGKSFKAHITIDNLSCNMEGGNTSAEITLAKYWNGDFGGKFYTHPNTPSTTYGSVAQLQAGYSNFASRPYYIKTTDTEHQVCLYYNNKEFCMGANYWEGELGVNNEAAGNSTKEKLKTAMEEALGESSLSCRSSASLAYCIVGDFDCDARSDGSVNCTGGYSCIVYADGYASCGW